MKELQKLGSKTFLIHWLKSFLNYHHEKIIGGKNWKK
jgi:hypothetical protein